MQRKRVISEMVSTKQGRGGHTSHFKYTQGRIISSSFCISHEPRHGQGKELCCVLRVYLDPEITSHCCITIAASSSKKMLWVLHQWKGLDGVGKGYKQWWKDKLHTQ